MKRVRLVNRALLVAALVGLIAFVVGPASTNSFAAGKNAAGGNVSPASASVLGYSLDETAAALAQFSDGGNNPALLPDIPFQVIYLNGTNHFDVKTGAHLFVPVFFVDDSPPVIGVYPSDDSGLAAYYFDPAQLGVESAQIEVDGKATDLGPDYVGGVFNVPLPNGGNNYSELGAFLTPLNKGSHTITIRGSVAGDLILDLTGGFPIDFEITYTVTVK
jgi:hypothetical protein